MTRFLSLHEAPLPDGDLCRKYDVPTYERYKLWAKTEGREAFVAGQVRSYPAARNFTPTQTLAFSVVKCLAITNHKPQYLVINKDMILRFVSEEGRLPLEFEEIPLVADADSPFSVAWIL